MTWTVVCSVTDIAEDGDTLRVDSVPPVAVYHSDGEFFATADTCSHANFSLSEGHVEAATVECPVHLATFCLRSGRPLKLPATVPVATFAVRLDGDQILVDLPG